MKTYYVWYVLMNTIRTSNNKRGNPAPGLLKFIHLGEDSHESIKKMEKYDWKVLQEKKIVKQIVMRTKQGVRKPDG
jgi:hypothetical protein